MLIFSEEARRGQGGQARQRRQSSKPHATMVTGKIKIKLIAKFEKMVEMFCD